MHLAAVEVYRNLEEWLLQKKEDDIRKRFRTMGARRAPQGVRLRQLVWALLISRNHLWHFLQRDCFVDNILEVYGELEVQQILNQFFDRAVYTYWDTRNQSGTTMRKMRIPKGEIHRGIGMNSRDAIGQETTT